jgi:GT2 family glycosyltransferase
MTVGVVAIGRNEGERLRACLVSARRDCEAVVYVDSGSTDGSAELARSLGVHVVGLDLTRPFTAARARNEGFALLRQVAPDVDRVQFVDGDCEIVAGWIDKAAAALDADPKTAIVCGRRRERFPDASVYNKLCDLEWNTPIGVALACGGDAMVRVAAFEQVGGYDPTVIAGEEPEMCVRLRHAGWTVRRIDGEMTLHDAAITRFGQWWKRTVRGGHAYAQANAMHGGPPERFRERELRRIERWAVWPIVATAVGVAASAIVAPRWCWLGLAPLLLYPVVAAKTAKYRLGRGDPVADAALYGFFVTLGKFPEHLGVRKFRAAQRSGRANAIIEYKGAVPS